MSSQRSQNKQRHAATSSLETMAGKHRQTTLRSLNGRFNILAAYILRRTTALRYILSQSEAGAMCLKGDMLPGVVGTAVRLSTGAVLATTAAEVAHAAGERAAGFAFSCCRNRLKLHYPMTQGAPTSAEQTRSRASTPLPQQASLPEKFSPPSRPPQPEPPQDKQVVGQQTSPSRIPTTSAVHIWPVTGPPADAGEKTAGFQSFSSDFTWTPLVGMIGTTSKEQ